MEDNTQTMMGMTHPCLPEAYSQVMQREEVPSLFLSFCFLLLLPITPPTMPPLVHRAALQDLEKTTLPQDTSLDLLENHLNKSTKPQWPHGNGVVTTPGEGLTVMNLRRNTR